MFFEIKQSCRSGALRSHHAFGLDTQKAEVTWDDPGLMLSAAKDRPDERKG